MSSIDTYGDFELPEEKSVIEVVEDPVKVVLSCHDMFSKLIQEPIKKFIGDFDDVTTTDEIYDCGVKGFYGKASLKTDSEQINEILQILNKKYEGKLRKIYYKTVGIFLSAFQNSTSIENLLINNLPCQSDLGYRLKKDKSLVLGSKIKCNYLGYEHAGTIINFGVCKTGINGSSKGLNINAGYINTFGGFRSRGIFINTGTVTEMPSNYPDERISINKRRVIYDYCKNNIINIKYNENLQELDVLLDKKLAEINFLNSKNQSYASKYFHSFNWKKFTEEVSEIAKRIQNKYYETGAK